MSQNRVAITGMGIMSSIGNSVEENLHALLNNKKGIAPIVNIETRHKNEFKVGEVLQTNAELSKMLNLPEEHNYSRTALLGCIAAKQAVKQANIRDIEAFKTGLISSTSVGGMDLTEKHFQNYNAESRRLINSHHAVDSTEKIAELLGITDFTSTISTACSSAANAIMLGARLIKSGQLDRVIVGGTDGLAKFTINGFKTLMILSDTDCTPFDANRKGLNLGEAAAYLVLESDTVVKQENKTVLGYLAGYGNANDAFHQTASSENGEGAFLAMTKALKIAEIKPEDVSYINAHGTATPNNDLSEGKAMKRIYGDFVPDFSSTKAFTGHTLAAAGAIEAVYSVLALQNNVMFPNLNFKTAIPELDLVPVTKVTKKTLNYVLSNSFGFGGNCSTLIFSKN
ncbi:MULTISPECIES: beta-ketoacyl-[acyl-carrier-protein] synthase family protein [Winogradskyella]|uniref:beta-ketoacyl-[acyl-carrier-protein] synthase family protein n=1 Tax=Winogradskyella TaxID=286104 RepID=UPI0015CAA1C3|nr:MULTISPECIES: beta-ketoacyl-[acyl-carrier-protein] synthase family protein [Winogradskyella]QXP80103.1 beta-ketoacyl-[acyl-carrier-protein] synthase family protein [Winogradskyella sp. HaHa_3_26]